MRRESKITSPKALETEIQFENKVRPQNFEEFVGQEKIKYKLKVYIDAAKGRNEPLDHIIFYGPPGLGKTTLAYIVAREIGVPIKTTSGPMLERPADLIGILTSIKRGEVLFIDEIHRLSRTVEEFLYSAMEDFFIDIVLDKGPHARTVRLNLEHFTLIGSTTRAGLISAPLRSRFGIIERLNYYTEDDLTKIVMRTARIIGAEIEMDAAREIAHRARGTPRIANRILRRIRDFAQVDGFQRITKESVEKGLSLLEIDREGLDEMDKRILLAIIEKFGGGPVGLKTLSMAVDEDMGTIEEINEPFLIQKGFIQITQRGRMATRKAYDYFSIPYPELNLWRNR
ncbi:Holliday junction branch migration DNA helicase RuvB [bacterium]|nr:MAG: Holliday junction branch migration DNA helicase RuvB [bacterium]